MGGRHREIGTDPSARFQFRRLPIRFVVWSGFAQSGQVDFPSAEVEVNQGLELLLSQTVHVSDRTPHSNRETSLARSPSHEAHLVAPEAILACSRFWRRLFRAQHNHSHSLECNSRQAVQAQPSDPDRVVLISAGVQSFVLEMGPATGRPFCYPVQSQTSQVCLTSTGSDSLGSRHPESAMGESGCMRLSSSFSSQPSDLQGDGSGLSQNENCSRVAQHALVLRPGQSICSDSFQASTIKGSVDSAFQRAPSQEPQQSEPVCLVPRASAIKNKGSLTKWQQELRLLRDSQPEQFTNPSEPFLSNVVIRTKWTSGRPL